MYLAQMENFLGKKYTLKSSENFEDYLVFIGKGYFHRKAALAMRPVNYLTSNANGTYTFHMKSSLVSGKATFTPGEEFEETRPDGVKVKAMIKFEGNKMVHTQTEKNGRISKHVSVFYPTSMIGTTTYRTLYGAEKTSTRHYVLAE